VNIEITKTPSKDEAGMSATMQPSATKLGDSIRPSEGEDGDFARTETGLESEIDDLARNNEAGDGDGDGNADLDQIKEAPEGEEAKDNASMKDVDDAPEAGDGGDKPAGENEPVVTMLDSTGKESLIQGLNAAQDDLDQQKSAEFGGE